jgi:hypothetical protein
MGTTDDAMACLITRDPTKKYHTLPWGGPRRPLGDCGAGRAVPGRPGRPPTAAPCRATTPAVCLHARTHAWRSGLWHVRARAARVCASASHAPPGRPHLYKTYTPGSPATPQRHPPPPPPAATDDDRAQPGSAGAGAAQLVGFNSFVANRGRCPRAPAAPEKLPKEKQWRSPQHQQQRASA